MSTLYRPKYIAPQELCSKEYYTKVGSRRDYILWQFNPLVLMTADLLRERFGSIVINNWNVGGGFSQRGLRTDDSVGATFSPHKRGAALDCNFKDASAAEVREAMKKAGCFEPGFKAKTNLGKDECFRYIGRIESTLQGKPISWFHFDIWNAQAADGSIIQLHC